MKTFEEQYCPVCGSPVVAVIIETEPVELKEGYVVHEHADQKIIHEEQEGENHRS